MVSWWKGLGLTFLDMAMPNQHCLGVNTIGVRGKNSLSLCTPMYQIEGNFGRGIWEIWRITSQIAIGEINLGEFKPDSIVISYAPSNWRVKL